MTKADRLERIKELRKRFVIGWAVDAQMLWTWDWLISEVEQSRENQEMPRDIYRHRDDIIYQRRHRKWALKKMRMHAAMERYWVAVAGEFVPKAQKAEAEIDRLKAEKK